MDTLSDIEILQFADISTSPGDLLAGNTLTSDSGAAPASLDPLNLAKLDYQPLQELRILEGICMVGVIHLFLDFINIKELLMLIRMDMMI